MPLEWRHESEADHKKKIWPMAAVASQQWPGDGSATGTTNPYKEDGFVHCSYGGCKVNSKRYGHAAEAGGSKGRYQVEVFRYFEGSQAARCIRGAPHQVYLVEGAVLELVVFSDNRYGDWVKLAEESLDDVDENGFSDEAKELAQRLYSILVSYLRGPAVVSVRNFERKRNGCGVWARLKQLYVPKTKPKTLALGQTNMQYPIVGSA